MKNLIKSLFLIFVIIIFFRFGIGVISFLVKMWYITIPLAYFIYMSWNKEKDPIMTNTPNTHNTKDEIIIEEEEIEEIIDDDSD